MEQTDQEVQEFIKKFIADVLIDTETQIQQIYEMNKENIRTENQIQQNQSEQKQQIVLDFSDFFNNHRPIQQIKKPNFTNQQPKNSNIIDINSINTDASQNKIQNLEEKQNQDQEIKNEQAPQIQEIPRNLTITQQEMKEKRWMDEKRWFCLSRPQYKRSCGVSSLVSCWNYLFSTLGVGDLQPISQEEAIEKLGADKQNKLFNDLDFGKFTGNQTLLKWWKLLCRIYKQEGRSYILYKVSGEGKTPSVDSEYALEKIKEGLRSQNTSFIYHAHDHYFCPIGYEVCPKNPLDAYKSISEIDPNNVDNWIMIGEPSKCYPTMHIRNWKDIVMDLELKNPEFYNIRAPHKGVQTRKCKRGGTLHCIMAFQKVIKKINNGNDQKISQQQDLMAENLLQNYKEIDDLDNDEEDKDLEENLDVDDEDEEEKTQKKIIKKQPKIQKKIIHFKKNVIKKNEEIQLKTFNESNNEIVCLQDKQKLQNLQEQSQQIEQSNIDIQGNPDNEVKNESVQLLQAQDQQNQSTQLKENIILIENYTNLISNNESLQQQIKAENQK